MSAFTLRACAKPRLSPRRVFGCCRIHSSLSAHAPAARARQVRQSIPPRGFSCLSPAAIKSSNETCFCISLQDNSTDSGFSTSQFCCFLRRGASPAVFAGACIPIVAQRSNCQKVRPFFCDGRESASQANTANIASHSWMSPWSEAFEDKGIVRSRFRPKYWKAADLFPFIVRASKL